MKVINKFIFIFAFIISSFLFINNIHADYEAVVLNSSGASCNLRSGSTGFCFYKDSNLNSYVSGVVWLDTGDKVNVLTDYPSIESKDKSLCSDYYVYASYYFSTYSTINKGYYCNAYLNASSLVTDELKTEFTNAGFPESYWNKLAILKHAHPNWIFKAVNTNIDFNSAVNNEMVAARSLVQMSASNNYAYLSTDSSSFNYLSDKYYEYDNIGSSNPWLNANFETIAYYLDPRNFLIDMHVFQFEGLSYDSTISDDSYKTTINNVFTNDYLSKFTDSFLTAGKEAKVNPVYLASLSKQEVGGSTVANTAISGTYNGKFNFYNIGATGGSNPVYNGLSFASNIDDSTLRPWYDEYRAIVGGALWIAREYISVGQDTSYFKKWNVVSDYLKSTGKVIDPYDNFIHQYMTNIMAPTNEANITYKSYYNALALDGNFVFHIPVYNNMPDITLLPTKGGWPNNYLKSLTINKNLVADFNSEVETYNYYLDVNTTSVILEAVPISSKATINGLGTFEINENISKDVTVVAQNGNTKTYKINFILTGEKIDTPVDILTTLNNAGIKNGNEYLSGISIGSDISSLKTKIINVNNNAIIELMSNNGTIKETGIICTGDKVKITIDNISKEYKIIIYGDVNGDGKVSAVDYVRIKNSIMGVSVLSSEYKEAADVDKNGKVSAVDYVKIKNSIMGTGIISQ